MPNLMPTIKGSHSYLNQVWGIEMMLNSQLSQGDYTESQLLIR